jgi:hypothetical protein
MVQAVFACGERGSFHLFSRRSSGRIAIPLPSRFRVGAGIDLIWRRIIFPHLVLVFAATITRSAAAAGAGREGSTRKAPLAPYDDLVQFIGGIGSVI